MSVNTAICVSLLLDLKLDKAVTDRQTDKQRQNRLSVMITILHMSMVHKMFTTFANDLFGSGRF